MSIYHKVIDIKDGSSQSLILKTIQPNSRVLEFGCSTGFMTRYMAQELGCRVTCVELDPEAAKEAAQYAEHMIVADLDTLAWEAELIGAFDYVIFADVLEHLQDPWKVLRRATQFLADGGHLITSIPNIAHAAIVMELINGNFHYGDYGLLDRTHLRFFTRKTIASLLAQAGVTPIEWMATKFAPARTEFAQRCRQTPLHVKLLLALIGLTHDYQYITVSRKAA